MPHGDGRGDYTHQSHQRRHPQRSSTVEMEKFAREVNKLLRQTQSSSSQLVGSDKRGSVSIPPRSYPREVLPPPPQYRTSSHNPHSHSLPPQRVQLLQTSSTPSLHPSHSPSVAYVCYPQHHQPQQPPIGYHYPLYVPSYGPSPPLEAPLMMMGDPSCHQFYSPQNWTPKPYPSAHDPPNLNTNPLSRPSSRQVESCNFLPPPGAPLVFMIAESPPPQLLPLHPPPSVHEGFSNTETRNAQRLPTLPCRNDMKIESKKGLVGGSKKAQDTQEVRLRSIGTSTMTPPPLEETDGAESDEESSYHETESSEGDEEEIQEEAFAFGERHKVMRSPQQAVRTPVDNPSPAKKRLKIPAVSCHRLKNFRSLSPLEEAPPLSPTAAAELQEKLEQTVLLLQDSSWERQFEGLAEFTGHLRSPENFPTIQGIMPRVISSLTKMIRSTRTRLSIEAIRTARFLFTCLGKRLDHFLCVLGMELFGKTIPAAKFIRDEAEDALQVAIHCCSPHKVMHLLESKAGGRHKHGKVRTVAASLMFILIHDVVGPKEILKLYGKEVLPLLLEWWEEPQVLIRSIANYSLLLFVPFKLDFERAVQNHVNIDVEMRLREKLQKLMNTKVRKRREKSA